MSVAASPEPVRAPMHLPCLVLALAIMLAGALYPPLLTEADGRVDRGVALFAFWAMSAGFVRGVGFVPRASVWRGLFSGWTCAIALALALILKLSF